MQKIICCLEKIIIIRRSKRSIRVTGRVEINVRIDVSRLVCEIWIFKGNAKSIYPSLVVYWCVFKGKIRAIYLNVMIKVSTKHWLITVPGQSISLIWIVVRIRFSWTKYKFNFWNRNKNTHNKNPQKKSFITMPLEPMINDAN